MNVISVKPDMGFIFNQMSAASVWTVNHNLGKYPSVTIVDSANTVVQGQVIYQDINVITIKFSTAFSGTAYLN
jgi:hypothetical protein